MKVFSKFILLIALAVPALGQVSVPPMKIKQRTLDNGLKFVSVQDKANPVVTVQVWYRVGGKDDPVGKSGFAHMFEHMMFKATKNMPNEMMDRITEDVGGWNNASTREDLTNYYEVIPSNYLETLLWAESDRMVNLSVDAGNFKSERDVVMEEYRQSVLAQPYGQLFQYMDSLTFTSHPYKRGVIGNLEELSAATLEDAFAFYRQYYRPDNASLIVVGDFDESQLEKWVDKYFGRLKNPSTPISRDYPKEPEKTEAKLFEVTSKNVPLPALAMTYLAPPSDSADTAALDVARSVLAGGESSRLYQEIVYKRQIAQDVSMFNDFRSENGYLAFFAISSGTGSPASIEKVILAELKRLQDEGPTEKELRKVKNSLVTNILDRREDVNGKAVAIGNAIIYQNDATAVNRDVAALQAVTADDVKRVVEKYLRPEGRTSIYYTQEKAK
ncbi:MAG: pitrilysin family protein [Pyrinomonadaceae bacterium]